MIHFIFTSYSVCFKVFLYILPSSSIATLQKKSKRGIAVGAVNHNLIIDQSPQNGNLCLFHIGTVTMAGIQLHSSLGGVCKRDINIQTEVTLERLDVLFKYLQHV